MNKKYCLPIAIIAFLVSVFFVSKSTLADNKFQGPSQQTLNQIAVEKKQRWDIDFDLMLGLTKNANCKKCHIREFKAWGKTSHFKTFNELHRRENAKIYIKNMGFKGSIRRQQLCMKCHYTRIRKNGKIVAISGVACESCHGPAKRWQDVHYVYHEDDDHWTEPANRKVERLLKAENKGMIQPQNIYTLAENCYNCHIVDNEKLVEIGGHKPNSGFELLSWSQGEVRHNYVFSDFNKKTSQERKRVFFVVGAMINLEYGLRGMAKATHRGKFYDEMKKLLRSGVYTLSEIKKRARIRQIDILFKILRDVKLRPKNEKELLGASYKVAWGIMEFTKEHNGSKLGGVDPLLPKPDKYKGTAHE